MKTICHEQERQLSLSLFMSHLPLAKIVQDITPEPLGTDSVGISYLDGMSKMTTLASPFESLSSP